ncbi:hypothetical protein KFK09_021511 [Dendrobium nobile]|uniref:Uncharacterized protein n=1 Tax=Dendrobium nobile TaxID=94219 RepID=A0A8T3AQ74_DENNO|nr:hypothetical protein KFK09_021511 [Dendrobium nobile]
MSSWPQAPSSPSQINSPAIRKTTVVQEFLQTLSVQPHTLDQSIRTAVASVLPWFRESEQ